MLEMVKVPQRLLIFMKLSAKNACFKTISQKRLSRPFSLSIVIEHKLSNKGECRRNINMNLLKIVAGLLNPISVSSLK